MIIEDALHLKGPAWWYPTTYKSSPMLLTERHRVSKGSILATSCCWECEATVLVLARDSHHSCTRHFTHNVIAFRTPNYHYRSARITYWRHGTGARIVTSSAVVLAYWCFCAGSIAVSEIVYLFPKKIAFATIGVLAMLRKQYKTATPLYQRHYESNLILVIYQFREHVSWTLTSTAPLVWGSGSVPLIEASIWCGEFIK